MSVPPIEAAILIMNKRPNVALEIRINALVAVSRKPLTARQTRMSTIADVIT
jgi:hypothetical protein